MRLKQIEIEGLFRRYNHHISLRSNERITVLHGRNGVGKTVTLSLVAALLKGQYSKLTEYPFRRLRIEFDDGSFVEARPGREEADDVPIQPTAGARELTTGIADRARADVVLTFARAGEDALSANVNCGVRRSDAARLAALERRAALTGQLSIFGDVFTPRMSSRGAEERLQIEPDSVLEEPELARRLRMRVPVWFIEAQRLSVANSLHSSQDRRNGGRPEGLTAVHFVAADMVKRVRDADSTYRATSTRLDDSLPARLFTSSSASAQVIPQEELSRRTRANEEERRRLHSIGLLADASATFDPNVLDESRRAMFAVYLKDNEEKFEVFKGLADRAEILLRILNHKFAPKAVKLDRDVGYRVLSEDKVPLDLDRLSSGEQHELVLLHELLFCVESGALLLIDEPELSLHVTWQDEFLGDLIHIAKTVGFDAIVATHSPYLVGQRRDLMQMLGEPV